MNFGMGDFLPCQRTKGEYGDVVYKSITVIGLGTLGGFVVGALSNIETVETLILIDHDTVEQKNLKNSIYRQVDIGLHKTEALTDIISTTSNITVLSLEEKYIEGKTTIPKCDLILDCRDYTYDRLKEVDARLYISSRYLMVDCRKNVEYKTRTHGKYIMELSKEDLRYAASLVSMLVYNSTIKSLIKNKSVQKYELDYVKHIDKCAYDIVYENPVGEEKFVNLPDHILPIIEANKHSEINLYVGSSVFPFSELTLPKNSLQTSGDVVISLARAVADQCQFNNFVVSLHNRGDNVFVELIPETGAA
jgi:hypothetical protein